jgi:predicted site-specific integrase-resolvase
MSQASSPNNEFLKLCEVITFFRISRSTFYRWVESSALKAKRVNGLIRISREEAQRLQRDYFDS